MMISLIHDGKMRLDGSCYAKELIQAAWPKRGSHHPTKR
jgi:hypothetical protein